MLPSTLNTNEVKNAAGTEVEFFRLSTQGRQVIYAQVGESPALEHRISVQHQETGSGITRRRRSVLRVDKTVISTVDSTTPVTCSSYVVSDTPVGALTAITEPTNVIAELMSLLASKGLSTTILYDGTGYGSEALLNGSL
jgi:hypothetical protein